jgi:hypothetical protein
MYKNRKKTAIRKRQLYTKGETIHKTIQKARLNKRENKHTNKKQT